MIALLTGWGLGRTAAKLLAYVGLPLLAILVFYLALDAYGDARYDAGVVETDTKWEEASNKLVDEAAVAADSADAIAEIRAADYAVAVATEKEKLDEAQQTGSSPLDVLFGADSVR